MENPKEEAKQDYNGVHLKHCYQGEYEDGSKYGEDDCPAKPLEEPKQHVNLINNTIEEFDKKIKLFKQSTKDKILSKTPDEVKQRVRDSANLLVNKQETLEEASTNYANKNFSTKDPVADEGWYASWLGFRNGAKWQMDKQDNFAVGFAEWSVARALGCGTFETEEEARDAYNVSQERMYSEFEFKTMLMKLRHDIFIKGDVDLEKWFNLNKK